MLRDHTIAPGEFTHFKTTVLDDGILLAGFDYFGKPVNVLNVESMKEWQKIVQYAEQSAAIKGVVLVSMKEGNFCAGADLEQMHDAQRRRAFQEMEQLVTTATGSSTEWTDRRNRLSRQWKAPVWAVDSSWCWHAMRGWPVPIRRPASRCRRSSWAFFPDSAAHNVCRD